MVSLPVALLARVCVHARVADARACKSQLIWRLHAYSAICQRPPTYERKGERRGHSSLAA